MQKIRELAIMAARSLRNVASGLAGLDSSGRVAQAQAPALFVSTEQTGTGGAQNIAHGLGVVPRGVVIYPSSLPAALGAGYTVTRGTDTTTNVVVTVTTGLKYYVVALV